MNHAEQHSRADRIRLSWLGWQLPPVLEAQFRRETDPDRNRRIRWWHGVGMVINSITFLLALWSVPELWQLSALMYLGIVMPILFVSRRSLAAPTARRWEMVASFLPVLAAYLAWLTVFALSPAFEFAHSMSLLAMGIIWIGAPIPLRVPEAMLVVVLALLLGGAINVAGAVLRDAPFKHPQLVVFSLVMIALSLVSRMESERRSRQTFLSGLLLRRRAEELEGANVQLETLSNTDPLTGLYNRRFLEDRLAAFWEERALVAAPMAALMIDIDHFKNVNDTFGHPQGDRCLVAVAQEIARNLRRQQDFVARYGGEEFVALLAADEPEARASAERIRSRISELSIPGFGPSRQQFVTVSIGVAVAYPATSDATPIALITAADAALLSAKQTGRNRVVISGGTAGERAAVEKVSGLEPDVAVTNQPTTKRDRMCDR
jgi:diguanylate cyclase (GGDEF)-like protein